MLCGHTRAGVLSPVSSLLEPHLFQEIIMLYSWLLTENHKPIPRIKMSLVATEPGMWNGGKVWSDEWCFCLSGRGRGCDLSSGLLQK